MSDFSPSDDELLSSLLDGELTADEATRLDARLENEPDLHTRLTTLRAAGKLTATPVPRLSTDDTEQLIATALAASTTTAENVTDLAATRQRKDRWRNRLVTAAAAIAIIAIAIPALQSLTTNNDFDTADSSTSDADSDSAGDDSSSDESFLEAEGGVAIELGGADVMDDLDEDDGDADSAADGDSPAATSPTLDVIAGLLYLTGPDPEFDPLLEDLGEFTSLSALQDTVTSAWTVYASNLITGESAPVEPIPANEEPNSVNNDSSRALADAYLRAFGGCGEHLEQISRFGFSASPTAVDYSIASVDDTVFTIGLFQLADGSATLLVLDSDNCVISESVILNAP